MQEFAGRREWKELVTEASRALARLDAERLEELAQSCRMLNELPAPEGGMDGEELKQKARTAAADMAVFGRVLEATRANLEVMNRLREIRAGRREYGQRAGTTKRAWIAAESHRGDD
jgi:hypothetical protein